MKQNKQTGLSPFTAAYRLRYTHLILASSCSGLSLILFWFRDQGPNILTSDIVASDQWPVTTLSAAISPGGAGARRATRLDALGPEVAREPREAAVTTPGVRSQVTEINWMIVNKISTIAFLILSPVCVTWTDFLVHHPVFLDLRGAFLFRQINSIPKMFAEMNYGRCGAFYF